MFEIEDKPNVVERACLLGIRRGRMSNLEAEEHLEELRQLVETMGIPIVGSEIAAVGRLHPALLVGTGRADQIAETLKDLEADCLIFDDDLSPSQQRNWEQRTKICVIDRREVILDIFAQRARTREARLQVQLARLEYSLPRLRRAWTHLERQRGGTGMRGGAGEMQLETDRRIVLDQIASIKRQLTTLRRRRATQRRQRTVKPTPTAAIIGYTNAGKSTLLNALTGADALSEDRLFATLDPLTRRITLPNNQELLLTDTVGFIRKLPHDLVASFKATLEEAAQADMLVHVVDASHPSVRDHVVATHAVLEEIGANDQPTILALNKTDLLDGDAPPPDLDSAATHVVRISAATGKGLDDLTAALQDLLPTELTRMVVALPHDRYDLVSLMHREGNVIREKAEDNAVWLEGELPARLVSRFSAFQREAIPA